MTDETSDDAPDVRAALIRLLTLSIGAIQLIAFLLGGHVLMQSADPLGEETGGFGSLLVALPVLGLTVPGLLLAWLDRSPLVSLVLVLAALPVAGAIWHLA